MTDVMPHFADAAQLAQAFERLRPGASAVYATGPSSLGAARNATMRLVSGWVGEGRATTACGRDLRSPGRWLYRVYRIEPAPPRANSVTRTGQDRARVLALLADHARRGEPCPSNEAIADTLDLSDARRARYLFDQLVEAGAVRVIEPARFGPRVIEVVSLSLRTKAVTK